MKTISNYDKIYWVSIMLSVILNKNEEINIINGYPWVFSNEINNFTGEIKNGEVCKVLNFDKRFVAYGFLNTSSKIMVRILSLNEDEVINKDFFKRRIKYAIDHRINLGFNSTRLVFSEADRLPGLIVDKYDDYLSVSFLSLGMEMIKKDIVDILIELVNPKGIYERSDSPVRLKEGLEEVKGYLYNEFDPVVLIEEDDIKMYVDLKDGQKTGYFLDQKLNRDILRLYAKDNVVLDAFSNVGGFALHAAKYKAKYVDACDISKKACDDIKRNAILNGFDNINPICVDVFDYLRDEKNKNKYDIIILDPPAFTKDKSTVKKAIKGYKEINLQALKLIKHGGYLFTFSCSQHMTMSLFYDTIKEAVRDSKRNVALVDFRIQAPDHPSLMESIEQLYLKCIILRVE